MQALWWHDTTATARHSHILRTCIYLHFIKETNKKNVQNLTTHIFKRFIHLLPCINIPLRSQPFKNMKIKIYKTIILQVLLCINGWAKQFYWLSITSLIKGKMLFRAHIIAKLALGLFSLLSSETWVSFPLSKKDGVWNWSLASIKKPFLLSAIYLWQCYQ
jgi:hypothetical protein